MYFAKVSAFPFVHEEFLLLVGDEFIVSNEHTVIDVDNGYDYVSTNMGDE